MRRFLLPAIVAVAVAVAWMLVLPAAPTAQPIAFNHQRHSAVTCTVCHAGAATSVRASIPQADVCARCHATAPGRIMSEDAWKELAGGKKIAWLRVNHLPEHVRFSHGRHVGAGRLACTSCHGDMTKPTTPPVRPATRLVMDTCIACHQRERASEDCAGCHR